jgi:hypothetical protein
MDGNSKIINVPVDECAIVTDVLATTGVDSCLVVTAIFDSTSSIFIGHYSTAEIEGFGELITLDNVQQFMETIVEQICENVSLDSLKTVFLIGGWKTKPYLELQELVENIRNDEKRRCSESISSNLSKLISYIKYVHLHFNLEHRGFNNEKVIR